MTHQREIALHNLLYLLNCMHHLYEAHFYISCMAEARATPARFHKSYLDTLTQFRCYMENEYLPLFERAGLQVPRDIIGNEEVVRHSIRRVERLLAVPPPSHRAGE